MKYELIPKYIGRKSFYGKAIVDQIEYLGNKLYTLFSYNTKVAQVLVRKDKTEYYYYGKFSSTTSCHQKEFFKKFDLRKHIDNKSTS